MTESLTLANVFAFFTDLVPRVEGEIRSVVDCLPSYFPVVFVIKGQHSAQKQVNYDTQGP